MHHHIQKQILFQENIEKSPKITEILTLMKNKK